VTKVAMDGEAYFQILSALRPDQVLSCLRADLISANEDRRTGAVAYLRRSSIFLDCFGIPEQLANVLTGPHAEAHQPALASLQALGWRGALALRLAWFSAGNKTSRARLLEALRQVSHTLDPATRRAVLGPALGEILEQRPAGPATSPA
jgi:hypothetical protein